MSANSHTDAASGSPPNVVGGGEDESTHSSPDDGPGGPVREQDRLLPIANVSRIMKMAVPSNAKIAKDAKETVQECVSEFIAFVTSEASDRCHQEKRKTINGEDLLWAMESLGFDNYVQLLKIYLQKYKESMKLDKDPSTPGGRSLQPEDGPLLFETQ